jgi:hypothetical protein
MTAEAFPIKEGRFPNRPPYHGGLETAAPCQSRSAVIDRRYKDGRSSSLFVLLLIIFRREERRHRFGE